MTITLAYCEMMQMGFIYPFSESASVSKKSIKYLYSMMGIYVYPCIVEIHKPPPAHFP